MTIRILMICLGNICRSPLAEGILKSKLNATKFFIDSAGTAGYHVGSLPDKRSINIAKINKIDITKQRSRKFEIADFDNFDYIYVMDSSNYNDIIHLARNQSDKNKVAYILKQNTNVPDSYYGGKQNFKNVFNMLNDACDIICEDLNN